MGINHVGVLVGVGVSLSRKWMNKMNLSGISVFYLMYGTQKFVIVGLL